MHAVAVTRFNDHTWKENEDFRNAQNFPGCLYNSPTVIASTVPAGSGVFVIEMNNTQRKILGIGLIRNTLHSLRIKVYGDDFYNQYTYYSRERIARDTLVGDEKKILLILEELVFYGSGHLQRGRGIQKLPMTITECACLLQALGENLRRRGNTAAAKMRLKEGKVDKEWIESNRGRDLVGWLRGFFARHFANTP
jgi:hypothetical protein